MRKMPFRPYPIEQISSVDAHWMFAVASIAIGLFVWTFNHLAPDSGLHGWDGYIATAVQGTRTQGLTHLMRFITALGSNLAVNIYVAVIALVWATHKAWREIALLLWIVPGGMLLNNVFKHVFVRARPPSADALMSLSTYSFPSGHMAGATLFYGFAALYLSRAAHRTQTVLIVCVALVMIMLTGLSRIYLGVHFFSDVLGGFSLACAWMSLSLLLVRGLMRATPSASVMKNV